MRVHVAFTPGELTPAPVGVVVDVLRATSTICQALAAGYRRVLCCAEVGEAGALAESEGPAKLGGERPLRPIEGLHLRNSPSAPRGLGASRSAANLRRHGLEADVERCARENVLEVVPRYVRRVGPAAEVVGEIRP